MISDKKLQELDAEKKAISLNKKWGFDLNEKEFIKGMWLLNPQSYGARIQNYIRENLNWFKVKAAEASGDIRSHNNKNTEVKVSLLTSINPYLNLVQIRLFHNVDYYLGIAYDLRDLSNYESYMFLLTHDQMEKECEKARAAHGTKSVNESNEKVEKALRISCNEGNPKFERWKKMYRVDSYEGIEKSVL